MELNEIAAGIVLAGSTVKELKINNSIVDLEKEGKKSFGLNINEPTFQIGEFSCFAQMVIDFEIEISQSEEQECSILMSLEGAFVSSRDIPEETFKKLTIVNGAAALIGIARGKMEAISANIFNNGKLVIPFVNVIDYYKRLAEE